VSRGSSVKVSLRKSSKLPTICRACPDLSLHHCKFYDQSSQSMPPRVPLRTQSPLTPLFRPYVCPTCTNEFVRRSTTAQNASTPSTARLNAQYEFSFRNKHLVTRSHFQDRSGRIQNETRRYASNGSLASTTAINAPATVPHRHRELHQRLIALKEIASSYVDLSRLQLAIRSLETNPPVVRVALLGLGRNGLRAARKLARVLLSDALGDEEAWEQAIIDSGNDGRSLLLRYGEADEPVQGNPLVRTMNIPSPYLRRNNLELLISALNTESDISATATQASLQDAILVPSLTTPNAGGRVGFVRYPVHKSVLVAEGLTGAIEYGRLPSAATNDALIGTALSLPLRTGSTPQPLGDADTRTTVDVDLASHALGLFRSNKANGAQFSEEWQSSNVGTLGDWISGAKETPSADLNPAVRNLILSVLTNAGTSVQATKDGAESTAAANTVSEPHRDTLQKEISGWSAVSHRDLQLNLDAAFADSPAWKRTTWWRLFWRIDDVAISASDVLRRSWLTESEQGLAFLSGRIAEARLATAEQLRGPTPKLLEDESRHDMLVHEAFKSQVETKAELLQLPSMLASMQQRSGVNAQFQPPWPQSINLSRQYMIHTLVPDLHRKAQALLLSAISTVGGSTALGAWFYVATGGVASYESSAIFALGLVWSLRRLQKKWSTERDGFATAIREDARRVLGEVEGYLRKLVREGGRATVSAEDAKGWNDAKQAVQRCEEALAAIEANKPS
jgi:hypothetical protein